MTEQQLISKIQSLKQITPRKDWVFSVKSEIFSLPAQTRDNVFENKVVGKLTYSRERLFNIFNLVFQRKFAYALAIFLFIFTGVLSFIKYGLPNNLNSSVKVVQQSPTEQSSTALVLIKDNVETFKVKSKNLADVARYNSKDVSLAVKEVKNVAIELTDAIQKDPQLAKAIALEVNNNKTYLDIPGGDDLKETSDILYKTIDKQMIKDLENTTLTESHRESLNRIKNLFNQGRYADALEDILLVNAASGKK